jgi:hypothetical protein
MGGRTNRSVNRVRLAKNTYSHWEIQCPGTALSEERPGERKYGEEGCAKRCTPCARRPHKKKKKVRPLPKGHRSGWD